jgi:hypothetical protein
MFLMILLDSQIVSVLVNYELQQNNPLFGVTWERPIGSPVLGDQSVITVPRARRNRRLYFRTFHDCGALKQRNR